MGKRKSQGSRQRAKTREARRYDLYGRQLLILPVGSIRVDPGRFQYKIRADKSGSVGSLSGISAWSFAAEGVLDVWLDPQDKNYYVVNGHNRLARAAELGIVNLACKVLPASTAKEARALGAIANIASGNGSALDAARFFRDGQWDKNRCKRYGISLAGAVARDGLAISKLCLELFNRCLSGGLSEKRAAILGNAGLTEGQQLSLYQTLVDRDRQGSGVSDAALIELCQLAKVSEDQHYTELTLFGTESFTRALLVETAIVQSEIRARLARDKRIYRAAIVGKETLESSGVGTIDAARGEDLARATVDALGRFDAEKVNKGPIATMIGIAARALSEGLAKDRAIATAYAGIIEYLTA